MRYASYGNGRPFVWLFLLMFLFFGGFRVFLLMLGLFFALFPLVFFAIIATIIFKIITKNQVIGGYVSAQPTQRNQFVELLVRLAVHVIQADGRVEAVEIATLKNFCHVQLNFPPSALVWVEDLIRRELERSHPLEELVAELKRIDSPDLGVIVLDVLYQIAHSDFDFHAKEEAILVQIAQLWGLSEEDQRTIKNRYANKASRQNTSNEDAYQVLGVSPTATQDEIKQAYRRLVKQFHPDVVAHLGDDFKKLAEQKMKAITDAYQRLNETS